MLGEVHAWGVGRQGGAVHICALRRREQRAQGTRRSARRTCTACP